MAAKRRNWARVHAAAIRAAQSAKYRGWSVNGSWVGLLARVPRRAFDAMGTADWGSFRFMFLSMARSDKMPNACHPTGRL